MHKIFFCNSAVNKNNNIFNSNKTYFISILSFLDIVRRDQYGSAFLLRELHHVIPNTATKMHICTIFLFILPGSMCLKKMRNSLASPLKLGPDLQWVRPKSKVRACGLRRQRMKLSSADHHSYFLLDDLPGVAGAIPRETSVLYLGNEKLQLFKNDLRYVSEIDAMTHGCEISTFLMQ